ncbi:MAG: helix-turn-helix transcriptional regulator [Myxococcota bacterium]
MTTGTDPDDSESATSVPETSVSTASIRELILGSWRLAIVVVDLAQRHKYSNAHGKQLLSEGKVLKLKGDIVRCADASLDEELSQRIAVTAAKNTLGDDGLVGWSIGPAADPSERVMIRLSSLVSPKRQTPLIELRLARAEADFVPPQRLVAHSLGLTKMQATVAVEIARGLTTAKIAEQHGIKLDTVKDHLKSVYQRLHIDGARERGVDAKTLLIRKIMALGY